MPLVIFFQIFTQALPIRLGNRFQASNIKNCRRMIHQKVRQRCVSSVPEAGQPLWRHLLSVRIRAATRPSGRKRMIKTALVIQRAPTLIEVRPRLYIPR